MLKTFSNIEALQRTNSRGHTASESVFIAGKTRKKCCFFCCFFSKNLVEISRSVEARQWILTIFHWAAWLKRRLKNSRGRAHMSQALKSFSNIRALQRNNSRGHTTPESVFYCRKSEKNVFFQKIKQNFKICLSSAVDFDHFSLSSLTSDASKKF